MPGSSQCAQVHRSPLQRQETQLHRRVHQRRHFAGNHQENGKQMGGCLFPIWNSNAQTSMVIINKDININKVIINKDNNKNKEEGIHHFIPVCYIKLCVLVFPIGLKLSLEPAGQFC